MEKKGNGISCIQLVLTTGYFFISIFVIGVAGRRWGWKTALIATLLMLVLYSLYWYVGIRLIVSLIAGLEKFGQSSRKPSDDDGNEGI